MELWTVLQNHGPAGVFLRLTQKNIEK